MSPRARLIRQVLLATEQSEGAGARVRRSIGTPRLRHLTPFLMLDHFSVAPGAGFPDHRFHRRPRPPLPGDLQFMDAGRGIVHAEMPVPSTDGSPNIGLQLWVDLPAHLKNIEPRYRDLKAADIPVVEADERRVTVKVISGQSHGVDSVKDLAVAPVWFLDFEYHNVVFEEEGDVVEIEVDAGAEKAARFVLVAGEPLNQEVVQYGPFVVTSKEEVYQAFADYQTHSNGFERAEGWRSEIGRRMMD
ncbi:RNA pol II transcription cofactor [Collariella sp. IMI 366227]|nr:RNA pol II transcription cofactor [Collariella sp. IMI 366227]